MYTYHLLYDRETQHSFHNVSVCFAWLLQLIPIISLNSTEWLAFIMEMDCILYEIGAEVLCNRKFNQSLSLEG
jgi:hypothetical protein